MKRKIFSMIGLLSMMAIMPACEKSYNVGNDNVNNQTMLKHEEVATNNNNATTNGSSNGGYAAEESKRVSIKLNVTLPTGDIDNDVYVIGDFNDWGMFNTLNDSTYKVTNGSVTITNVEANTDYSYMFVQRITGAKYTYNFGADVVDSNGEQIIGYTAEGKMISQYCIAQTNDAFTVTATNNKVATATVTGWTTPAYGGDIQMASKYDEPDAGYHLYVIPSDLNERPYYIPLESDGSGYQIFAIGVQLKKYDAVKIYDANTYTLWGEDNIEPYGAYREFVADPDYGMVCWVEEGQYDIYVKLSSGNDSIYVGWTGAEAPVNVNYQLCVTPQSGEKYYINLTPYDEFDGFAQHRALNVHFQAGDLITLYDVKNNAHWAEDTLDQYGEYRKFTSLPGQGIRCDQEGYYDVYVKFKYEQDQIYIGPGTNG